VLKAGLVDWPVRLTRNEQNLGFAGGHNLSIRMAESQGCDYVWLLNSDAIADPDSLTALVTVMESDGTCGSCSPVIVRMGNRQHVDFCGAAHNWSSLGSDRPVNIDDAPPFAAKHRASMWAVGTAVLFRVAALKQVGYLDDRLFAYFEDDDIGERLIKAGWSNRMAFDSQVQHACFDGVISDRKPYYFYLMTRNSFLFFLQHTPSAHRRLLRLRLIDYALVTAIGLRKKGMLDKANACLLGIADGLAGRYGPPALKRKVPLWVRILVPVGRLWNRM
jgi:GT2 family glycosyltransferase